jgi:hypothetical protein
VGDPKYFIKDSVPFLLQLCRLTGEKQFPAEPPEKGSEVEIELIKKIGFSNVSRLKTRNFL